MANHLTINNIVEVLFALGSGQPIVESNAIRFNSICHTSDKEKHKLYCYNNNGKFSFYCYVCGFQGSLYDLVMHKSKCDFVQAKDIIDSIIYPKIEGYGKKRQTQLQLDDIEDLEEIEFKKAELIVRDKKVLDRFKTNSYYQGWIDEGINVNTMRVFDIGLDVLNEAIIIPHFDMNGNLVGIRKRNLNKITIESSSKYMPVTVNQIFYNHPLSENFYGIHINVKNIKQAKSVYVFESEKSVMQMYSYGFHNALAICGSNFSKTQGEILQELGVKKVYLCFDRDWENREDEKYSLYLKKVQKAKSRLDFCDVYYLDKDMENKLDLKDSPSDKGREVFEYLRDNSYKIEREKENE